MLDDSRFEMAFQINFRLILDLLKGAHFEMIRALSFRDDLMGFHFEMRDGFSLRYDNRFLTLLSTSKR